MPARRCWWVPTDHPASEVAIALAFVGIFPMLGMDWRDSEAQGHHEILAERLAGFHEQYPDVHVKRVILCDKPSRWLLEKAEHAQLVVVGSHGRGGFAGMLLGSASSHVAQAATVPVIVSRAR